MTNTACYENITDLNCDDICNSQKDSMSKKFGLSVEDISNNLPHIILFPKLGKLISQI